MRFLQLYIAVALTLLLAAAAQAAAQVTVQAAVDQQEVFTGETFALQIQVEGNDTPGEPDLSPLTDFTVEARGGQQNSSESVTIVNGRMNRVSRHGYVFNYGLTPKKAGRLIIPALTVTIDQQAYRTQPIGIMVKKPVESNDFKLRLGLEKSKAYVGEPVPLTVTWYIGKDVNGFNFNLPFLSDPRFAVSEGPNAITNPSQGNVVRIPMPGGEILAEKGNSTLDGQNYLTVSFSKMLTAKQPGTLTLPQSTVTCQALSRGRQGGGRDPFSGLMPDDFFGRSRQVYRTEVVPSNEPTLEVLPLPEEGRPADFSGLVGSYSLAVTATPTTVKVGDPITLTIQIAGPAVAEAKLPPLDQALGPNDFKVPGEMAPGAGSAVLKTFTQTVRARHSRVRQVPSLSLGYFNPVSGRYETASSQPVALEVTEAKTVTAQDAEGEAPTAPAKKELQAAQGGINFNYEGPEVLLTERPVGAVRLDALWSALLAVPPAIFVLYLIGLLVVRYGRKDPEGRAARAAYRHLQVVLDGLEGQGAGVTGSQRLGLAMREYLGATLRRNPASLTYADAEPLLARRGVSQEGLSRLRQVMEQCEAYEYAGSSIGAGDLARLAALARQVAAELEVIKSGR